MWSQCVETYTNVKLVYSAVLGAELWVKEFKV